MSVLTDFRAPRARQASHRFFRDPDNEHQRRRLRRLLHEISRVLPGEWVVRGDGLEGRVVRKPIDWTVAWVGYRPAKYGQLGWLYAGVQPVSEAWPMWSLDYGGRLGSTRAGSGVLDLSSADAIVAAEEYVTDALPTLTGWTTQRLIDSAEKAYVVPMGERPTQWRFLPGWRVISGSASPVEPAAKLLDYYERKASGQKECEPPLLGAIEHCRRLIKAWEGGGRAAALKLLEGYREITLTRWGLEDVRPSPRKIRIPTGFRHGSTEEIPLR